MVDARGYIAAGQRRFEQEPLIELRHTDDHPTYNKADSKVVLDNGEILTVVDELPVGIQFFLVEDDTLYVNPEYFGVDGTPNVIPAFVDGAATFQETPLTYDPVADQFDGGNKSVLNLGTVHVGPTAPDNPANGQAWLDTSGTGGVLKIWYEAEGEWYEHSHAIDDLTDVTIAGPATGQVLVYNGGWVNDYADAQYITYTPSQLSDWDLSADPGNVDDALDQLADRLTVEEAHVHAFNDLSDVTINSPATGHVAIYDSGGPGWDNGFLQAQYVGYTPAVPADWDGATDPGNTDDALDQLAERTTDLEGWTAADLPYTPNALADWDGSADPGNTDDALDQLAERVADIEGIGIPAADATFPTVGGDEIQYRSGTGSTLAASAYATVDGARGIGLGFLSAFLLQPLAWSIEMTGAYGAVLYPSLSPTPENGLAWYHSTLGFQGYHQGGTVKMMRRQVVNNDDRVTVASSTSLTAIQTWTILESSTMSDNDGWEFNLHGTYTNNTGSNRSLTVTISWNGSTIWSHSITLATSATARAWNLRFIVGTDNSAGNTKTLGGLICMGAASAPTTGTGAFAQGTNAPIVGTLSLASGASISVVVSIQHSFSSANLTLTKMGAFARNLGVT